MNKHLGSILTELNPLHDFDNITFEKVNQSSLDESITAQLKNLSVYLTIAKPLVRGALIGGTIGTMGSIILGDSPKEGFAYGAVVGGILDFKQYMWQGIYFYVKKQLS